METAEVHCLSEFITSSPQRRFLPSTFSIAAGRWAAQLFDQARDVQQDQSHVDKLFAKKTCAEARGKVNLQRLRYLILVCRTFKV